MGVGIASVGAGAVSMGAGNANVTFRSDDFGTTGAGTVDASVCAGACVTGIKLKSVQ